MVKNVNDCYNSSQADFHNERAINLAEKGWIDEAVKELKKAIKIDPENAAAYDNLANIYCDKGKLGKALNLYLKSIEIEPDNPTAHFNLGCFLATKGQELAVLSYNKSIKLEWDFPDAHLNLGLALLDLGDSTQAETEFRHATTLCPDDYQARFELALLLLEGEKYTEAIKELRTILKNQPDFPDANLYLGAAYVQKGFLREGEKALKQALVHDDSNGLTYYYLAVIQLRQNKEKEAIVLVKRALQLSYSSVLNLLQNNSLFDKVKAKIA